MASSRAEKAAQMGIYVDRRLRLAIELRINNRNFTESDITKIVKALKDGNAADGNNAAYLFKLAILKYNNGSITFPADPEHKIVSVRLHETLLDTLITPNDRAKDLVIRGVVDPIMAEGNDHQKQFVYDALSAAEQKLSSRQADIGKLLRPSNKPVS